MVDATEYMAKLAGEREQLGAEISSLQAKLEELQMRHNDISGALHLIQRIENVDTSDVVTENDKPVEDETLKRATLRTRGGSGRIKSTEMIAELVTSSGRPWTRDELHKEFDRVYGIPSNWKTPQNALNNALGRAVEKELIAYDGSYYRPNTGFRGNPEFNDNEGH